MPEFDTVAHDIASRQYFTADDTSIQDMFERVVNAVYPDPEDKAHADSIFQLMMDHKFSPGGRILAGAGTAHGNLLNCFVQDGSPETPGTTEYALLLARKLALVTKVGGGNGLNLDSFPAHNPNYEHNTAHVYLKASTDDLTSGTYTDLVTGQRVTKGYRVLRPSFVDFSLTHDVRIRVPDSTEGIWDAAARMVRCLLDGKDVYLDLDALRPEGASVRGSGGTSSGAASFAVEVFDSFAYWATLGGAEHAGPVNTLRYVFAPTLRCIRQGGVRRGAGMATLSTTHPDVLDFIGCKALDREAAEGDISTFNISVLATRDFMFQDTYEHAEILDRISEQAWMTGEPGLLFIDTINEANPLNDSDGPILATNPCGEIGLYPGEPCDLGALNISAFVEDCSIRYHELHEAAYEATRFLDHVLDREVAPLAEIAAAIRDKRRIGLGIMGLGDALIKMGYAYDTPWAREVARAVAETIRDAAIEYSEDAARKHGTPFGLQRAKLPRRNIALLTVAPTGTTSMLFGTTSGIEPLFAPFIYRRVGTDYVKILHPLFREQMEQYTPTYPLCHLVPQQNEQGVTYYIPGGWNWEAVVKAISDNHGSVQGLEAIPERVRTLFRCAHDITPKAHIDIQAAVQDAFDFDHDGEHTYAANSISKTINFGNSTTVLDIRDALVYAWYSGVKGVTVYRDGSRGLQVLNTGMEDDGSSSLSQSQDEQLQDIVNATCSLDGTCDV